MKSPTIEGVIQRRLLINYRVDPDVVEPLLPAPFRPQLVHGHAVAGICLLSLTELRPRGLPRWVGVHSQNVAHRFAVEWDTPDGLGQGVYIPRRDSGSLLNVIVGGRAFPGRHHRARFIVAETDSEFDITFQSTDRWAGAHVQARLDAALNGSVLFADLNDASRFFEDGSIGYSDSSDPSKVEGVHLVTNAWQVQPLTLSAVTSTYFDDPARFPPGSATLDCGLLMRNVPVTWEPVAPLQVRRRDTAEARPSDG
jgi:hypothetical protein